MSNEEKLPPITMKFPQRAQGATAARPPLPEGSVTPQDQKASVQRHLQALRERHPNSPINDPKNLEREGGPQYALARGTQRSAARDDLEVVNASEAKAQETPVAPPQVMRPPAPRPNVAVLPTEMQPTTPKAAPRVQPQNLGAAAMSFIANQGHVDPTAVYHNPSPAVAEGEAISLDLPSRFVFYPYKDTFATTFKNRHLTKLSRARKEENSRLTLEVLSSTVKTSHPELQDVPLAHLMVVQDYFFLLYWQRRNSYTGQVFRHRSVCRNPMHIMSVEKGEKTPESLVIEQDVSTSRLRVRMLDNIPDNRLPGSEWTLRPPVMQQVMEWSEHPKHSDLEWQEAAEVGLYLDLDLPLDDKVEIALDLTPDQVLFIRDYEQKVNDFGVDEFITATCKECGASHETRISFDAHSFLPTR